MFGTISSKASQHSQAPTACVLSMALFWIGHCCLCPNYLSVHLAKERANVGQVRIKLKHMEVEIRRRETTGAGAAARNESETLAKYEIMDGAPVRGENIPIR